MAHGLIIGMTESGKSHLAKSLARSIAALGAGVLVLHKPNEPWPLPRAAHVWQTADPERFLAIARRAVSCSAFLEMTDARHGADPEGEQIDVYDRRFHALATDSRHNGLQCFFIAQRSASIHPNIRENCGRVFLFKCGPLTARTVYDETAEPLFLKAPDLPMRHYIERLRAGEPAKRRPPLVG